MSVRMDGTIANWQTDKSFTTDILLHSPFGSISFKVVAGKRLSVYSGFDTWDPSLPDEDQSYVLKQRRMANKYHAPIMVLAGGLEDEVFGQFEATVAGVIQRAIVEDETVQHHWLMFIGDRPAVASARKPSTSPLPSRTTITDRQRELMAADPEYGRF